MNRHYLIVDDNRAFAENVGEIVRDLGDEVSVVDGGPRALELAQRRRFDALVTDMRMPVMDGSRLVRGIRAVDPRIPVVVVTAHVGDAELAAARAQGLLAVLSKPVPIGRLLDLLAAARRDGLVVIVEDNRMLAENLCDALRERGFASITAESVLETEGLEPLEPFVALADLRVTGGPSGEAMLRLVRKYPGLPVLAMTGYSDPPPVRCDALFRKPFRTEELLAAVERCHAARSGVAP